MEEKKKHRLSLKTRNRILAYINAAFSVITILAGVLVLTGSEMQNGLLFAYIGIGAGAFIALIQEVNVLILRHDKRSMATSIPCIAIYVVVLVIPDLPMWGSGTELFGLVVVIIASIYMAVRFGKLIYLVIVNRPKHWIPFMIILAAILIGSILYICLNLDRLDNVTYYLGMFLVVEGLIIFMMSLVSGGSAVRFIRILVRTHAVGIIVGLLFFMLLASVVLAMVEPEIKNFGDAMWHCFATITTIGFGDYYIVSFPGRIVTVLLGIYGIVVVALITSVIVNFYNDNLEQRRKEEEEEKEKIEEHKDEATFADIVSGSPHQDGEDKTNSD
ncbi:MAG: two pore domain potassium channel family protein [Bacilli bacterium]|nr:two pore domain potassium channel family protein [Bacilli bacterium]